MSRSTDRSLAIIANRAGYESEFAFSRSFKRAFGVPPSTYRHRDTADEQPAAIDHGIVSNGLA